MTEPPPDLLRKMMAEYKRQRDALEVTVMALRSQVEAMAAEVAALKAEQKEEPDGDAA